MRIQQLTDYLNIASDDEKQRINKEINKMKKVQNKEKSDALKPYRLKYYNEVVKPKKTVIKPPSSIVLKSRNEIIRDDGTIEYHETWYDKEDRMNNKKFINN
jgi:hypothetical protein